MCLALGIFEWIFENVFEDSENAGGHPWERSRAFWKSLTSPLIETSLQNLPCRATLLGTLPWRACAQSTYRKYALRARNVQILKKMRFLIH